MSLGTQRSRVELIIRYIYCLYYKNLFLHSKTKQMLCSDSSSFLLFPYAVLFFNRSKSVLEKILRHWVGSVSYYPFKKYKNPSLSYFTRNVSSDDGMILTVYICVNPWNNLYHYIICMIIQIENIFIHCIKCKINKLLLKPA